MPAKEEAGRKSCDLLCILCPVLPTIEGLYDNAFPRRQRRHPVLDMYSKTFKIIPRVGTG